MRGQNTESSSPTLQRTTICCEPDRGRPRRPATARKKKSIMCGDATPRASSLLHSAVCSSRKRMEAGIKRGSGQYSKREDYLCISAGERRRELMRQARILWIYFTHPSGKESRARAEKNNNVEKIGRVIQSALLSSAR